VTLVGEQGPELVDLGRGGAEVFSAGRTQQMLRSGGSAGAAVFNVTINGNRGGDAMYDDLLNAIRRRGSASLVKALGL
jgi:hypothetical protein